MENNTLHAFYIRFDSAYITGVDFTKLMTKIGFKS